MYPATFDGIICICTADRCFHIRSPLSPVQDTPDTSSPLRRELCGDTRYFWGDTRPLTVSFLDPVPTTLRFTSERIERFIKTNAEEWTRGTSLSFEFLQSDHPNKGQADIRISFRESTSWSVMGTTFVEPGQPTMSLHFENNVTEWQITGAVLHEFGHALGFEHEHSSPHFPLHLNYKAIFDDRKNQWTSSTNSLVEFIKRNFMKLKNKGTITASPFDERSVMMYEILPHWNVEGKLMRPGSALTVTDRETVQKWYPPRPVQKPLLSVHSLEFPRDKHRLSF
ncbi:hypothetical protein F4777DRAFT_567458 [Nemania sp. FL0916]|nr:hypothetical protein F4777DRAFT_567458 [Nemania sp. FL0916]